MNGAINNVTINTHPVQVNNSSSQVQIATGTETLGKSMSAIRMDTEQSIRRIDRFTLSAQKLGRAIGIVITSILKLLPGPDVAVAVKDTRTQFTKVYPEIAKKLEQQRENIFIQLKKEGFSDNDIDKIQPDFDAFLKTAKNISPELLYNIAAYQNTRESLSAQKSERGASVLNVAGSSAGAGWAAAFIASKSTLFAAEGAANSTAAAGSVLNLVAAGILIPLQLFLIGRDVANINTSRKHIQHISKDSTALNTFTSINNQPGKEPGVKSEDIKAAQELLERRKSYNKQQMAGSIVTTIGDTTTLVSGILTLSGIGAVVGIPMSVVGFIVSISGTTLRSSTQKKADAFIGKAASESARQKMASTASRANTSGVTKTIQDDANLMNHYQMMVAESKLHSLMNQVLKDARKSKIDAEPEALYKEVERRADKLMGRLKKTSLLESDLNKLQTALKEKYTVEFFNVDSIKNLQKKLNNRMQENMDGLGLQPSDETTKKVNKAMTDELFLLRHGEGSADIKAAFLNEAGKKKTVLTTDDLKALCEKYPHIEAAYDRISAQHLIKQLKTDSKFLRYHATESFINSAHAATMAAKAATG